MKGWLKTLLTAVFAIVLGVAYALISRSAGSPEWFSRSFGAIVALIAYFHFEGKE